MDPLTYFVYYDAKSLVFLSVIFHNTFLFLSTPFFILLELLYFYYDFLRLLGV